MDVGGFNFEPFTHAPLRGEVLVERAFQFVIVGRFDPANKEEFGRVASLKVS